MHFLTESIITERKYFRFIASVKRHGYMNLITSKFSFKTNNDQPR